MPENDQTRWIGIRPTNPAENIPTTTRKLAPAISDLQAVKGNISKNLDSNAKDCTVEYVLDSSVVPAGEIWVINHLIMWNETTINDMMISIKIVDGRREVAKFYSYDVGIAVNFKCFLVLVPTDYIRFTWLLGGGADNLRARYHGYKIGVY